MALGNRECLGDREAHRGGDGDALSHTVLEHVQTGGRRRQLDGDVWRPRVKPPGHRQHLVAIAGTRRVDLRTDEAVLAAASFKRRQEPAGGARHRDLDVRFGKRVGRQTTVFDGRTRVSPGRRRARHGGRDEDRIRRDAAGAAIQRQVQLGGIGRVVPPAGRRAAPEPVEIRAQDTTD